MCGYCTEKILFSILERQRASCIGRLDSVFECEYFLQEEENFHVAVNAIAAEIGLPKISPNPGSSALTFLCRGLELLLRQGFDSPSYQKLLGNHHFRLALKEVCTSKSRKKFDGLSSEKGFSSLILLYEQATYTDGAMAKRLQVSVDRKAEAKALLQHYIRWWLLGHGLQKDKQHESTISIFSHRAFYSLFLAVWYSVVLLGPEPEGKPFLCQIAATNPSNADFIAYDLWLQRKAMLLLFDREWLSGLGKGFWPGRASLLYYLDLKRGLTSKQKKFILASFTATQESEVISLWDDLCEYGNKSWLDWLTDTEAAPIFWDPTDPYP